MTARMANPAFALSTATRPLMDLGAAVKNAGLSPVLIDLVNVRASQINGCSVCLHMHLRDLRKAGESDERQLATLVLTIGMINLWNRLNIATRQVAGAGY